MQAIQTRYIGPTNYLGSRVKAFSDAFAVASDAAMESEGGES